MSTRTRVHEDEERQPPSGTGLSLKDLVIAAASSAAAALIVSQFWQNGTLIATAMTPVIVAIARELLARPVETVGQVGRKISAVAPAPAARRDPLDAPEAAPPQSTRRREGASDFDPVQPEGWEELPPQAREGEALRTPPDMPPVGGPRRSRREAERDARRAEELRRRRRRRAILLGLVTGL